MDSYLSCLGQRRLGKLSEDKKKASVFGKIIAFLQKLVVKVDQLIKRRAQQGLIAVNVDWAGAQDFVKKHIDQEFTVSAIL